MDMKYIILITSLLVAVSCGVDKEVIVKSTIKLEGKNTNIRDLIEIDGYYPLPVDPNYHLSLNPNFGSIMFFEDGTWVYFHFISGVLDSEKQKNMSKYIDGWMKRKQFHWGFDWGVYSIQHDTIIVHSYNEPNIILATTICEKRYKIIDRKTIQIIFVRFLLKSDYDEGSWIEGDPPMYFMPADSLPSSDSYSWLKKEKWIWRNEQDWKNYMEKIKQKKKER